MWVGLALYAGAVLLLVLSPEGNLPCVVLYVFMWAVAAALINPRKDALLQLNINPQERARDVYKRQSKWSPSFQCCLYLFFCLETFVAS